MKIHIAGLAIVALMATTANAQQTNAPGQLMHDKGSVKGTTGASGYAPGHKMHESGSVKGTVGSSGYAPGRTGASVGAGTNTKVETEKAGAGISGGANVKGSVR